MRLWKNEDARVPLALIGVLFVLISAGTSLKLSQMDARMASSMATNTDINAADTALLYARADLARIVNYAGMAALKQMGETPVIEFDPNSQYNTSGMPDTAEFNRNWAKGMMTHTMNQYIESNYMYDRYQYRGYAVNVEPIPPDLSPTPLRPGGTIINVPVVKLNSIGVFSPILIKSYGSTTIRSSRL